MAVPILDITSRLFRWTGVPVAILIAGGALLVSDGAMAQEKQRLAFIGVFLGLPTRQADQKLADYFLGKTGIALAREDLEYEQAINRLVNWRREDGLFVARVTPYAYVVAELLGADVEPLASYVSRATTRTTNRSFLVVNRQAFNKQPDLADVERFLTQRTARRKFVYQSPFSTSSFFVPSVYFRSHQMFQMDESTEALTAIAAERIRDATSSTLVEIVARGEADVAAVWDGVKVKYETDPGDVGDRVYFVPLPTRIPNDLLVCASGLDESIKTKLKAAIESMGPTEIDVGDFLTWRLLSTALDARQALGDLRQAAREGVAPITVSIEGKPDAKPGAGGASVATLVDAARQAVRLSETEFVVFDADFHEKPDFHWTLEPIHDGAVMLRSTIPGGDVDEQAFQLSFRDEEDLTVRIVSIIQSRMHRIRYVWPHSAGTPTVIRDSAFPLPVGTPVKVQRITWIDPRKNQFLAGQVFDSRIVRASFYRYELRDEDFHRPAAGAQPDPLSNVGFRVILMRAPERPMLFRAVTAALVACFLLAGVSAAWTLVRRPSLRAVSGTPGPG